MSHAIRTARALALLGHVSIGVSLGGLSLGCGGLVDAKPSDLDAGDASDSALGPTVCKGGSVTIECAAGDTCEWPMPMSTSNPQCIAKGEPANCGTIACSSTGCICNESPSGAVCNCYGMVTGPLPPPDLPAVEFSLFS
jgi:hypothetical protein